MKIRIFVFLVGLLLFLYPTLSEAWNSYHQSRVIRWYEEKVEDVDENRCEEWLNDAREYNQKIKERGFLTELSAKENAEYHSILNMNEDGMIGYLFIPTINCRLPIYHGTEESVLQIGAGHLKGTSFPVKGESVHSILSGHRGLPSARLFTGLDRLQKGDMFQICILNEEIWYEINQIQTVLPKETKNLKIIEGKELCTLVTCTPYGINTHRLLITGQRTEKAEVEFEPEKEKEDNKGERTMNRLDLAKWTLVFVLIVLFWFSSIGISRASEVPKNNLYEIIIQYKFPDTEFKIYKTRMEDRPVQVQITDKEGKTFFKGLEAGEYVIVGMPTEENGYRYTPVITKINLTQDFDGIRTIVIEPKYEKEPIEDTTEESDEKNYDSMLPQTGQTWSTAVLFLITGLLFLAAGWMKSRMH